jgi:hypothetical protein
MTQKIEYQKEWSLRPLVSRVTVNGVVRCDKKNIENLNVKNKGIMFLPSEYDIAARGGGHSICGHLW